MLLIEFRNITRGRLRRSRVVFWLLTAAALTIYVSTFATYAFPGVSARWIAWLAGLDAREVPTRPLLSALGGWAAGLPWVTLAIRLNLLAVISGAMVVGMVYKIVWFLVFDMMCEESAVAHASRNALFGGIVAALAAGVSLPMWQAATVFRPEIFDVALLLCCAHLLTVYARSKKAGWLLLFASLYGLGFAESPLFIAAAPVMAAFAVMTEWKLAWCRYGRLVAAALLAAAAMAGLHYLNAYQFLLKHGDVPVNRAVLRCILAVLREQAAELGEYLPTRMWFPVVALGVGAAGVTFFTAFRSLDNRRNWSLFALNLILTLFALLTLFNATFAPWGVMALRGCVPAATYALFAIGLGLLTASWRAWAVLNDPLDAELAAVTEDDDVQSVGTENWEPRVFAATRGTGILLAPILAVAVLVSGVLNLRFIVRDQGAFADQAADVVLDNLRGRTWLLANGLFDHNLLIRAQERGVTLHLLGPYRACEPHYIAKVIKAVSSETRFNETIRLRAESLINYNFHVFIEDLFAIDDMIQEKAVCMGLPDLWYGAGWTPLPELLFYGGFKEIADLNIAEMYAEHVSFWKRFSSLTETGVGVSRQFSHRYRRALLRHMAVVANNLGVIMADAGEADKAFQCYLQARNFNEDNISALLNLFEMTSRGHHPEMKGSIAQQLRQKVEQSKERYPLWSLSRYHGYVRNYDMFVRMGWSWALSSSPSSVLAGLRSVQELQQDDEKRAALSAMMASIYEMRGDVVKSEGEYKKVLQRDPGDVFAVSGLARLALHRNVVDEARKILEDGEASGAPHRQLRQDWAALYLVAGDLARARVILQNIVEDTDASPMTLAMLAMVMIEQQDVNAVETKVLPRLQKSVEGKEAYFAQVVQGRVWQSKGKAGYKNARLCFQRAAMMRPDVLPVLDVLLMLDVSLADSKAAAAHALSILRQIPEHPYANFIIGSLRLEQGEYGDAEKYLKRSVSGSAPRLAAMNNYAQALCRIRRLDEAEEMARRAVKHAPERYEAWSTLAFVLAEQGKIELALEALSKAHDFDKKDPRLFMVDALVSIKTGNLEAAEKAVGVVSEHSEVLSVAERRELQHLQDEIVRLRR
ncbi:MAG: tetratricopeptide repeat protein [Kiritimatiellae bacterium]|nr:tetratricopeptide repeat protein [Kiritimatiellia bacterium]